MNKLFGLIVVAVCLSAVSGGEVYQEIFATDCNGGLHFGVDHKFFSSGMQAGVGKKAIDFLVTTLQERAVCHCPSLTEADLEAQFTPNFENFLRVVEATEDLAGYDESEECYFQVYMDRLAPLLNVEMPSTCTYSSYSAGDPCLFEWSIPEYAVTLQFAVQSCGDDSIIPYFSISCSGDWCHDLMRPCASDADCFGDDECVVIDLEADNDIEDVVSDFLNDIHVFLDGDDCVDFPSATVGRTVANRILSYLATLWGSTTGNANGIRFCGLNRLQTDVDDPDAIDMETFGDVIGDKFSWDEETNTLSIVGLQTWDGTLDDTTSVTAAGRKDGSAFPDLQIDTVDDLTHITIASFECDGTVGVFPNAVLSAEGILPDINAPLQMLASLTKEIADCRAGSAYTKSAFEARFDVLTPTFWLNLLTVSADNPALALGTALDSPYTALKDAWDIDGDFESLLMPAGCDAFTWTTTGACNLAYDNLEPLLGENKDFVLNLHLEQCSTTANFRGNVNGDMAIPRVVIDCQGADCASVLFPYDFDYCTDDSDCTDGRTCSTFGEDAFEDVFGELLWEAPVSREYVRRVQLRVNGLSYSNFTDPEAYKTEFIRVMNDVTYRPQGSWPVVFLTDFNDPNWMQNTVEADIYPYWDPDCGDNGCVQDTYTFGWVSSWDLEYHNAFGSEPWDNYPYWGCTNCNWVQIDSWGWWSWDDRRVEQCDNYAFLVEAPEVCRDYATSCAGSKMIEAELFTLVRKTIGKPFATPIEVDSVHGWCQSDLELAIEGEYDPDWEDTAHSVNGDGHTVITGLTSGTAIVDDNVVEDTIDDNIINNNDVNAAAKTASTLALVLPAAVAVAALL